MTTDRKVPETQERPGVVQNLIITGFMGTGKTAVGQEVARRLERPFVDMDAEIETRAGRPIPRIFAEDGEPAFREMEARLCEELAGRDPTGQDGTEGLVIATGGGALLGPGNRGLMTARGLVICLNAHPNDILRRVSGNEVRPLLDVTDPAAEIERLLAQRRDAYAALPWHIDTSDCSLDQVVEHVMALAEASTLSVRYPGGEYAIRIGVGLLEHVGGALRAAGVPQGTRVAVVSNEVVAPLHAAPVEEALRAAALRPFTSIIPDGEQHKTLSTVASLYDQFLAAGLDRGGAVVSLGGGVVGDVAGFAAATFMRGVRFAPVPTSLLAMVDASVGGKTGVDLPQGKNLAGAFKQPTAVTIDPSVLATLDQAEFRSGMAEVIKHGVIGDPALFAELEKQGGQHAPHDARLAVTPTQIARALRVKVAIVEEDPYERGRRAALNLGHTVGHALEKLSGFELRHGEAVSIGIAAAARIAAKLGRAEPAVARRIESTLTAWDLPIRCPAVDTRAVWQTMTHDKKRRGGDLHWVLPIDIGRVTIVENVPRRTVLSVLEQIGTV
jgi:3-dehydroquinate synthase